MATIVRGEPAARRVEARWLAAREAAERAAEGARAEAARVREEAWSEAERLRAEAREAGRQEGLARATEALAAAVAERDRLLARAGAELVHLAVDVARRVIGEAAARDPGVAIAAAERALAAARTRTQLSLRVHPEDAAAVRAALPRLEGAAGRGFALVPDGTLARGDARVETEAGCVEARLEPQLAALRRALEEP